MPEILDPQPPADSEGIVRRDRPPEEHKLHDIDWSKLNDLPEKAVTTRDLIKQQMSLTEKGPLFWKIEHYPPEAIELLTDLAVTVLTDCHAVLDMSDTVFINARAREFMGKNVASTNETGPRPRMNMSFDLIEQTLDLLRYFKKRYEDQENKLGVTLEQKDTQRTMEFIARLMDTKAVADFIEAVAHEELHLRLITQDLIESLRSKTTADQQGSDGGRAYYANRGEMAARAFEVKYSTEKVKQLETELDNGEKLTEIERVIYMALKRSLPTQIKRLENDADFARGKID